MDQTIAYYNKNAQDFCENTKDADMGFCRDKFLQYLTKGSCILDAGCGSGRDTKEFIAAGYDVVAMDASAKICEEASKYIGQPVLNLTFHEIDFVNEFDGIWACASLLHVSREEMGEALNCLRTALKEDGVLYASFKYGDDEEVINGRFFNYYNETSAADLFKTGSFDVLEIFITQDVREGRKSEQWVNILARKRN